MPLHKVQDGFGQPGLRDHHVSSGPGKGLDQIRILKTYVTAFVKVFEKLLLVHLSDLKVNPDFQYDYRNMQSTNNKF